MDSVDLDGAREQPARCTSPHAGIGESDGVKRNRIPME